MTAFPGVENVLVSCRRKMRVLPVPGRLEVPVTDVEPESLGLLPEFFVASPLTDDVGAASDVNHFRLGSG